MSAGLAQRPCGDPGQDALVQAREPAARACSVSSVSNQPGRIALTWMLSAAQARARLLVSWTIPPLLAA